MQFKHALACWRPHQYSEQVQPMITTPGHGSFPSGHATQAFVLARLLDGILPVVGTEYDAMRRQLYLQAARIATNRVVAGVHFPVDGVAGRLLGHSIAEHVLSRLNLNPGMASRTFHGKKPDATDVDGKTLDLDLNDPVDLGPNGATASGPGYTVSAKSAPANVPAAPALRELYRWGIAERASLGLVF
jgi:hypothetical protein